MLKSLVGMSEAYFWRIADVYRHIDVVVCCSEFLKRRLDTYSTLSFKTIAMYNFVQADRQENSVKKDYVIYFGRFSQEKGIETLLSVCKQLPEITFVFAGSGPLEKEINQISNIRNVGFCKGETLRKLISEARFSITPSEVYENCPFSVMESQMYGTPVLGARIGGIPELIEAGKSGELFESGNAEELRQKIQEMWNETRGDNLKYQQCNGDRFDTVEGYAEKLIQLYSVRH